MPFIKDCTHARRTKKEDDNMCHLPFQQGAEEFLWYQTSNSINKSVITIHPIFTNKFSIEENINNKEGEMNVSMRMDSSKISSRC
jgi:hypothetical protein